MHSDSSDNSDNSANKKAARTAGLWYLAFTLLGAFSYLAVDAKLLTPGDAAATLDNITSNLTLFWLGFATLLAGYGCFVMLAMALRKLFRPVNIALGNLMMVFVLAGIVIVLLGRTACVAALYETEINNASRYFAFQADAEMAAGVFWGLWLIPLGLLILKSNLIPNAIGILALAAGVCNLAVSGLYFLAPEQLAAVLPALTAAGMVGEFSLILWLLIKGVKQADARRRF